MTDGTKKYLDEIVEKILNGKDLAGTLNKTIFQVPENAPQRKWSFNNRFLCAWQEGFDCRGYQQWKEVKREVKKGCHAIYILGPILIKKNITCKCNHNSACELCKGKGSYEKQVLTGFRRIPVFKYQGTSLR